VSIEKAIEIDTARGRPSGTATIIIVTAVVKKSKSFESVSLDIKEVDENRILKT
jgi:hypothetical protein